MMSFKAKFDNFFEMHKCDLDPVAHVKLLRVAGTTQMSYLDEFTIKVKKISSLISKLPHFSEIAAQLRIWPLFFQEFGRILKDGMRSGQIWTMFQN